MFILGASGLMVSVLLFFTQSIEKLSHSGGAIGSKGLPVLLASWWFRCSWPL